MQAVLKCDVCAIEAGAFETYDAWSDAASALRWEIGEDVAFLDGFSRLKIPVWDEGGNSAWPERFTAERDREAIVDA